MQDMWLRKEVTGGGSPVVRKSFCREAAGGGCGAPLLRPDGECMGRRDKTSRLRKRHPTGMFPQAG